MPGNTKPRLYWMGANAAPAQDQFFLEALDPGLWREGDAQNWDTCWYTGMPASKVFSTLTHGKTINHIPGNNALTVKSLLYKTLKAAQDKAPAKTHRDQLSFFPRTYSMPDDFHALQGEAFRRPDKKWILKPKRSSRGRGIRVIEDAGAVPLGRKWMVQEYLAEPHLYDGHKYVLRCYLLISSIAPLRVYLYKEGFVKQASELYTIDNFDNVYAHLTNPDVNALNQAVDEPVVFQSFQTYRAWLRGQGLDDAALFRRIREISVLCAIAARDAMRARTGKVEADTSGCYELIGLDLMIDEFMKPWLLECNLSPSLAVCADPETGGREEEEIKRAVIADLVTILGLNEASTDTAAQSHESFEDGIIARAEWEHARAGGFDRIFPDRDAGDFLAFFPIPPYADMVLARAVSTEPAPAFSFKADRTREFIFDDGLALYSSRENKFYAPAEAASFIWLKAASGAAPDAIADALARVTGGAGSERDSKPGGFAKVVWDALAEWGAKGLLCDSAAERGADDDVKVQAAAEGVWHDEIWFTWDGRRVRLRVALPEIAARLETLIANLRTDAGGADYTMDILAGASGYTLSAGPRVLRAELQLNQLAPALFNHLIEVHSGHAKDGVALRASFFEVNADEVLLIGGSASGGWDSVALMASSTKNSAVTGGAAVIGGEPAFALPIAAPLLIAEEDVASVNQKFEKEFFSVPHELKKDVLGRMIAPLPDRPRRSHAVRALILPVRERLPSAVARLERVAAPAALVAVSGLCLAPPGGFDDACATKLAAWLAATPVFYLHYGDPQDAAHAIHNFVEA